MYCWAAYCFFSLVVVHDFNVVRAIRFPPKTDAKLIVDPDAMLAMPISLLAAILPGDSGMPVIMVVDFIMLSPVQAIMAAEAGDSAKAENIAAEIKSFM